MKKKEYLIIDTNVPLKAANLSPESDIDRKCSRACFNFIKELMNSNNIVVLDSGWEILKEYKKRICGLIGENVATEFLEWIYRKRLTDGISEYKITKNGDTYEEFPNVPELERFDRSDRKFVALANAHPNHPHIINGSDTDWWNFKDALEQSGIHIVFLSEEYMKAKSKG